MTDKVAAKMKSGAASASAAASVDPNGIQLGAWSHPLAPEDESWSSSLFSRDVWCPCFPLAQVEARAGVASYGCALFWHLSTKGASYLSLAAAVLLAAADVYAFRVDDKSPSAVAIVLPVVMAMLALAQTAQFMLRLARTRGVVRERFDIPGSAKEDRTAAWQEPARAIRQMRRHLQIESAPFCGAVETLPAYAV